MQGAWVVTILYSVWRRTWRKLEIFARYCWCLTTKLLLNYPSISGSNSPISSIFNTYQPQLMTYISKIPQSLSVFPFSLDSVENCSTLLYLVDISQQRMHGEARAFDTWARLIWLFSPNSCTIPIRQIIRLSIYITMSTSFNIRNKGPLNKAAYGLEKVGKVVVGTTKELTTWCSQSKQRLLLLHCHVFEQIHYKLMFLLSLLFFLVFFYSCYFTTGRYIGGLAWCPNSTETSVLYTY